MYSNGEVSTSCHVIDPRGSTSSFPLPTRVIDEEGRGYDVARGGDLVFLFYFFLQ